MTLTLETKLYQIYIISAVSRIVAMVQFELQSQKSLLKTELVKESGNNDSW